MVTLGRRLQRLFVHTADIYRPEALAARPGKKEAADVAIQATPIAMGVQCWLEATPEFDERAVQGLTKQINILTSDKWHFLQSQEIADAWLIVMKTPSHPDYLKVWTVQGNPTSNASAPGRPTESQWVFAKVSPKQQIAGL